MAGYDDCSGKFYNFGGSTVLHIFVGFSLSHSPKPSLHRHSTANVCYLQPPSSINTVRGWVHTACMSCLSLSLSLQWQNLQKQLLVRDICPEEGLRDASPDPAEDLRSSPLRYLLGLSQEYTNCPNSSLHLFQFIPPWRPWSAADAHKESESVALFCLRSQLTTTMMILMMMTRMQVQSSWSKPLTHG